MEKVKKPWYRGKFLYFLVPATLIVMSYFWYLSIFYHAYHIPSEGMEDTLLVGDYIMSNEFAYIDSSPERGDIIVFIYPRDQVTKYVKRCIALPGDTVFINDRVIFINGIEQEEPATVKFISNRIKPRGAGGRNSMDNYGPFVVPDGSYFVMGDNRDNSSDSRIWGTVPEELLIGKVSTIHWSKDWDRIGMTPK